MKGEYKSKSLKFLKSLKVVYYKYIFFLICKNSIKQKNKYFKKKLYNKELRFRNLENNFIRKYWF